jgi:4-carboxymuconolactone decarboxylase
MSRVPEAVRDDFPEELKYVWDAVAEGREVPRIFKAMGNNPHLLRAYLRLGNGLWNHCGLDLPTRELVILRAALNKRSVYEWHQHVRIGRDAGLRDERIDALHNWQTSEQFDEREKVLLAYADAMSKDEPPPAETLQRMVDTWGLSTTIGVTLLVPFYEMTGKFLAAMDVQPEEPFVGWQL